MSECVEILHKSRYQYALALASGRALGDINGRLSDFERFSLMCESLPLLSGTDIRKEWIGKLYFEADGNIEITSLGSREEQKRIWRLLYGGDGFVKTAQSLDFKEYKENFRLEANETFSCLTASLRGKADSGILSLDFPLEADNSLCKNTLKECVENLLKSWDSTKASTVFFDCREIGEVLPNPYSSELAYKKIIGGENYNSEDISSVRPWLLSSITAALSPRVMLRINSDTEGIKRAERIISYIEKRGEFCELCICTELFDGTDAERLLSLCAQKNISSEIIAPEEMSECVLSEILKNIAAKIPLSYLRPCRFIGKEKDRRLFVEVICSLLEELCYTESDARLVLDKMLG